MGFELIVILIQVYKQSTVYLMFETNLPFKPSLRGSKQIQILTIFICLGAFVFSYNAVCLTQLADQLKRKNKLTDQQLVYQLSIATSCFNFGAFVSPLFYQKLVSKFGELRSLFFIDLIGLVTIALEMIQLQFEVLVFARLTLGFVIGISTAIIPVYINSIAPPLMVGKLGTFNQLLQTLGVVVAYIAGSMISEDADDEFRWRIYLGFPALFLVLRIVGLQMIYRFETLERHLENGETGEIKRYCQMVYGSDDSKVIQSVVKLKSFKKISQQNESTFKRRFIIALVVIASNQFSGANSILFYAKQLFGKITHSDASGSQTILVFLSIIQVITVIYSTRIIDKLGRRILILEGQAFVIFCLFGIFLLDKVIGPIFGRGIANIGIILLIFLYLIALNLTLGPCCIVYCAQIVQDLTWIIFTLKGLALLIALTSQFMIQYLGIGFMFLLFFLLSLSAHLYLQPRLKETKGLTTQQIYSSFKSQSQSKSMFLQIEEHENLLK